MTMPTPQELKATERDTTVTPRQLRAAGYIPATLYGNGMPPQSLQVRAHEFSHCFLQGIRAFRLTGFIESNVKAQHVQRDPVSQQPISIQFLRLDGAGKKPLSPNASKSQPKIEQPSISQSEQAKAETVLSGI
jgi:ribosomal protein L25 (general stress protein Ctc)